MSPAARRPPTPVRRPAERPPRPSERDAVSQQVVLPETREASPQSAAAPAPAPAPAAPAPAEHRPAARPPVRGGRATGVVTRAGDRAGDRADAGPPGSRRPPWRLLGVLTAVVLLLAGAGWALLVSPLTDLTRVTVTGADRTGSPAVEQAAADQLGLPLLRVDTGGVADRVRAMPWVASVRVERDLPHGLDVVVVERTPVAAVAAPDGAQGVVLLDGEGKRIVAADAAPEGVPLVAVDVATAGAGAVRAASAVALALPADLREQVTGVTALGPDDVRLALRSGQEVRWGGPGEDALKARVALLLLAREGVVRVDVSAPTAPATA